MVSSIESRRRKRLNVWRRCKRRCHYCRRPLTLGEMTIDHVVPRSRGGTDRYSNLVAACHACNQRKADRMAA